MIITRSEVKTILGLVNEYIVAESVTFDSVAFETLTYGPNVEVLIVAADTKNSTVSSTEYDTGDYYTTQDPTNYEKIRRIDTGDIGDTDTVYVSYTYNDYDTLIDALIPIVQRDLVDYLNNIFPDKNTQYCASSIKINSSGTITDTNGQFEIEGFSSGMDIAVEGTYRNSGIYNVEGVSSDTLTLSSGDTVLDESATDEYGGNIIQITRVNWPVGLKSLVAQIIWFNIDRAKKGDIKSKRLGPGSITYMDLGSGGYPANIYSGLNKYRYTFMS